MTHIIIIKENRLKKPNLNLFFTTTKPPKRLIAGFKRGEKTQWIRYLSVFLTMMQSSQLARENSGSYSEILYRQT